MARRFRIYLFGFILGLIIVYSSLIKDRGKALLGWLPSPRVLAELKVAPRTISSQASCQLKCLNLGESFVEEVFENGDIIFRKSKPKETPRLYLVEVDKDKQTFEFNLSFHDSTTTIVSVFLSKQEDKCNCN